MCPSPGWKQAFRFEKEESQEHHEIPEHGRFHDLRFGFCFGFVLICALFVFLLFVFIPHALSQWLRVRYQALLLQHCGTCQDQISELQATPGHRHPSCSLGGAALRIQAWGSSPSFIM
jgi:hypothetical protein